MIYSTTKKQIFPLARLSIFIKGTPVLQGKFYYLNEKPVFLVNIDKNKLWTKFNGYSIANQILETFSDAKIRPLILYKFAERNLVFQTTPSTFKKKGIPILAGGHRQLILTIPEWKYFKDDLQEPYNLPSMSVDSWLKPHQNYQLAYKSYEQAKQDYDIKKDSMMKLKEIWESKVAHLNNS